MLQITVNKKF